MRKLVKLSESLPGQWHSLSDVDNFLSKISDAKNFLPSIFYVFFGSLQRFPEAAVLDEFKHVPFHNLCGIVERLDSSGKTSPYARDS